MNLSNDNIVTIVCCIITAFLGYITCKLTLTKPESTKIVKKQFYKVYLPLFRKIEPNLYSKNLSIDTAEDYINFFNNLKATNYELIDCRLLEYFSLFELHCKYSKEVSLDLYTDLCYQLSILFDSTRKKLHMPTRSLMYKIINNQFPQSFTKKCQYILMLILKILLLDLCFFIFLLFLSYTLYGVDYVVIEFNRAIEQLSNLP